MSYRGREVRDLLERLEGRLSRAVLRGLRGSNAHSATRLGWYRHLTLVLLAYAFLVGICVQENQPLPAPEPAEGALPEDPLIALTTSEVRHLLARLIWPAPTSVPLICQWSRFRRAHQYWAGYYHRRRRQKAA